MKLHSLAHLPLPSCCVAWFLIGCGPVLVPGPGTGDPCSKGLNFALMMPQATRIFSQLDSELLPFSVSLTLLSVPSFPSLLSLIAFTLNYT